MKQVKERIVQAFPDVYCKEFQDYVLLYPETCYWKLQ